MRAQYSKITAHYATSLVDVAQPKGMGEQVGEDLMQWAQLLREHPPLAHIFQKMACSKDEQIQIIEEMGKEQGFASMTVNFLKLLVEKGRAGLMEEVAPAYQEKLDDREGIARARIESAKPLTDSQVQEIQSALETIVGKEIRATSVVNSELLGGVRAEVKSTIYDGSLASRFEQLRDHLSLKKR